MLRHAIAPSRRYTKASHDVVRHPRLTGDAKILLLYVQGLTAESADRPLSEHARKLGITGRAYQKAKELLVVNGFLHEQRQQGVRGLWATAQLLSNVSLTPAEAATVCQGRASEASEAAVCPGARDSAVGEPAIGEPVDRSVGRQLPVDEEREKHSPHPPSEVKPTPDPDPEVKPEPEPGPGPEATLPPEVAEGERVLLSLRHACRELYLGAKEARTLAALAAEWLRRGITAAQLRRVLTSELPEGGVRSAVGFLRYRLVHKLPEEPRPEVPVPKPVVAAMIPCAGPGEEHLFRPVRGEELCGPCGRTETRRFWLRQRELAEGQPAPLPWRERFAAVNGPLAQPC
ncbi:hypothetical protein STHAL_12255 [Streptomyces halstedii]|uniref:Helix-turn-helix domain-containing protein n=1 Tax=Streptomyces halstedii TaxID=1944 RepID=A0ABS6TPP7_STRHA|nr:hypothetical protein [Streptomyces halstedii]MBV7670237.1 hypothetical protein [Streptomyces halstedii]